MTSITETFRCFAGDVSDIWEVGFQTSAEGEPLELATLDVNFTCKVAVPTASPAIDRAVTVKNDDNTRFRVWLTGAETAQLAPRDHVVAIQIRNDTLVPPLLKETQVVLRVRAGAIA